MRLLVAVVFVFAALIAYAMSTDRSLSLFTEVTNKV
jgi:hypothetical protein